MIERKPIGYYANHRNRQIFVSLIWNKNCTYCYAFILGEKDLYDVLYQLSSHFSIDIFLEFLKDRKDITLIYE